MAEQDPEEFGAGPVPEDINFVAYDESDPPDVKMDAEGKDVDEKMQGRIDRHNEFAPRLLKHILEEFKELNDFPEEIIILESVLLGYFLIRAPNPAHASMFLSVMRDDVVERMLSGYGIKESELG